MNSEIIFLTILWLGLSYMGLSRGWYKIKHFDKLVHLLAGIAITSYLVLNAYSINQIIIINIILAIAFEYGQIFTEKIFNLKKIGFPDGYYDIAWHLIGTIGYLQYRNML